MSQSGQSQNQNRVIDLKVSGHLMTLDRGLFCVFHVPSQEPPSPRGLPGVRLTQPPLVNGAVTISTFDDTGWLGGQNNAALIRVMQGPAQVLVTIYQEAGSPHEAPRLQVVRLSDAAGAPVAAAPQGQGAVANIPSPAPTGVAAAPGQQFEVGAHIQRRGDVGVMLGEWMGKPGSRFWIEGFGISPGKLIAPEDIEYQAVLGKGWLSPWTEGGKYCGSRGMALPILGLRVRLKGDAAEEYLCELEATFTDGTEIGPVGEDETAESDSLAPLEAFRVTIIPRDPAVAAARREAEALEEVLEEDLALLEEEEEVAPVRKPAKLGRPATRPSVKPAVKVAASAAVSSGKAPKTQQAKTTKSPSKSAKASTSPKSRRR
ncbi:hypothetical protein AA0242T_0749 [Acetobacter aceti NRIC 0242]|uniref:Hydrophobic W protein n=1 Tax=Acetobacter aceti NBRC 14818 TaxID=887700 RepID=A0AB33IGN5_ACEAC|nr:hypothetical protein [Acetobacter aceti]TCS33832.1 hydrophobic W protein [Acetobacter aceti NBRC 14818]BCK76163.1 hypothetical protein EMQ_1769 [Acetobacter aceti NBRC 14818]GAN57726.1 hypothetical protein Abac_018_139 [Acetobacter aceti NBRC 14818]GBO80047.1 hypothetical protein AA0242T_0749 [Acetobacter aceti NRIC 0242]